MRAIIFLLLIILIFLVIRFTLQRINQIRAEQNRVQTQAECEASEMVKCKTCDIHLPQNEAILKDEHFYCSKTCLENTQHTE